MALPHVGSMRRKNPPAPLSVVQEAPPFVVTASGTFKEGDLAINRNGITIDRGNGPARSGGSFRAASGGDPMVIDDDTEPPIADLNIQDLKLLDVVGQGSSGVVQRALHTRTGRILAIKVVPLNTKEDKVRKQILLELRTLHDSACKYIVSFHGAFYNEGAISIALEYMDGGSLLDLVKMNGPIPENMLAHITIQILKGLAYLHKEKHIIHRDIKPSNFLINSRGQVKISDFGVSGQLASSLSSEQCASWCGTVCYMSPERISGQKYSYDSDIWSVGLSLVECALGRFPYPPPGENTRQLGFWELMDYIVSRPPPTLPSTPFSPEFCNFVDTCLKKNPAVRPTANELLVHPWINMYVFEDVDISGYIRTAVAKARNLKPINKSIEVVRHRG
eukprot:CAMPEP_0184349714 /NCGR_PEP_ID=MMETSP1089-20130417/36429_1 /TAXON_ID=38269 ORGANISM="Gloeochaete wittrockiana, Strain SAG46.84" /NCGR_SAMPLE_ID=MMETSP1089 /ASSEMBLY_ACC=CAM_ASM_000445 /LENGTH=390 /DNA_ID=CAMNT_0026682131 /DNA_START=39 /DNA_END=1211 /DNA_ORIENTATION=+